MVSLLKKASGSTRSAPRCATGRRNGALFNRGREGRSIPRPCAGEVQPLLDKRDAILVADGGEFGQWAQACLSAPRRLINGPAGSIGSALPVAAAGEGFLS